MKILATTKVIPEPDATPCVSLGQLQTTGIKRVIDPSDEASLLAAANINRGERSGRVTAVCVGTDADKSAFRRALSIGADDAVLIKCAEAHNALDTATLIRRLVILGEYELVLLSNKSSDNESGQTAQALASLLGWAHLSNVTKISRAGGALCVWCLLDKGRAQYEIKLPCVIACNARVAKSRFVSLSELADAKTKRIRVKATVKLPVNHCFKSVSYAISASARSRNITRGLASALELILTCC